MKVRTLSCLAVCAGLVASAALAQSDAPPPLPDRNPVRVGMVLPPKPVPPGEEPTIPWTDAEVSGAKAACKELLKTETVDYDELPPIKEGLCGTPAPILVRSVGSDPKVVIDPPATISCPMAKELSDWLEYRVQPEAKKFLGSTVVGLHNATSYACRNRYGSDTAPLSEHALANALDVSDFVFASGTHITVLDNWPKAVAAPAPTDPEVKPKDEAAPKGDTKDEKDVAVTKAKAEPGAPPTQNHAIVPDTPEQVEPAKPDQAEPAKPDPKAEFLTAVHDDACKEFGTVLGPEANAAHKNHFHLDMKTRKHSAFCQ
jgi:hypothetical protein